MPSVQNTAIEVQIADAKQKASRVSNALEQNIEMQNLLRDELLKKNEEISFRVSTMEDQERQMAYDKAEIAALKSKLAQQDQAGESTAKHSQELQAQVEQLRERNLHLQLQVLSTHSVADLADLSHAPSCLN